MIWAGAVVGVLVMLKAAALALFFWRRAREIGRAEDAAMAAIAARIEAQETEWREKELALRKSEELEQRKQEVAAETARLKALPSRLVAGYAQVLKACLACGHRPMRRVSAGWFRCDACGAETSLEPGGAETKATMRNGAPCGRCGKPSSWKHRQECVARGSRVRVQE